MKTQEALVENTFQGLIICFVMSFFVLLFSTMDLRVGLISTVTIAGVVTTVMGIGVYGIMKWSLGIGESIAAVILIGLSVDYCVHLANAYCEAPLVCDTRELRTQHALMTMGISITASAVTTIVSGSMLWLCILTFFSKFAFLITATVLFARCFGIGWTAGEVLLVVVEAIQRLDRKEVGREENGEGIVGLFFIYFSVKRPL